MTKRVFLKISGEMFSASNGSFDFDNYAKVAKSIADFGAGANVDIAIVVGAGNIWRYRDTKDSNLDRVTADQLGMTATIFNAKLLESALQAVGQDAVALTDFSDNKVMPKYNPRVAREYLDNGHILILAGGTGNPFFTTDSAAALRALELDCEILLKATKVDGVYSADPKVNPNAERYKELSYDEVLKKKLEIMDLAAISLCRDNALPVLVFDFTDQKNLAKVFADHSLGTLVS